MAGEHICRVGDINVETDDPEELPEARLVEPWLAAVLQAEHCSVLLGTGTTIAVATLAGASPVAMNRVLTTGDPALDDALAREAESSAIATGRGQANVEDYLRVAMGAEDGIRLINDARLSPLTTAIDETLAAIVEDVLHTEAEIQSGGSTRPAGVTNPLGFTSDGYLVAFLAAFAARTPTRDRLHVFTTNYDRLIERAADLAGYRILDRFVGLLDPTFSASRMLTDLHYVPPGLGAEPRLLEGVLRLTKLHGSLDWLEDSRSVRRVPLPFGASSHPSPGRRLLIYPNSVKDVETAFYPYADLFRDFSGAICRPNSVLVTYGYGFGDDHINRVIDDMLTIPSTFLLVISYDEAAGRVMSFLGDRGRPGQVGILMGSVMGSLSSLVNQYLPRQVIDSVSWRRAKLLRDRGAPPVDGKPTSPP